MMLGKIQRSEGVNQCFQIIKLLISYIYFCTRLIEGNLRVYATDDHTTRVYLVQHIFQLIHIFLILRQYIVTSLSIK